MIAFVKLVDVGWALIPLTKSSSRDDEPSAAAWRRTTVLADADGGDMRLALVFASPALEPGAGRAARQSRSCSSTLNRCCGRSRTS